MKFDGHRVELLKLVHTENCISLYIDDRLYVFPYKHTLTPTFLSKLIMDVISRMDFYVAYLSELLHVTKIDDFRAICYV